MSFRQLERCFISGVYKTGFKTIAQGSTFLVRSDAKFKNNEFETVTLGVRLIAVLAATKLYPYRYNGLG